MVKEDDSNIPALNSVAYEHSPTCDNSYEMSCPHVYDGKEILKHQADEIYEEPL